MPLAPWLALSFILAGPETVQEAWRYAAQPGWRIFFQGVNDGAGNLYWAECGPQGLCDIVSASSEGALRFRVPAGRVPPRGRFERGRLVSLGDLLIEAFEPGVVRARRSLDGGEIWSHPLGADLCAGAPVTAARALDLHSITAGPAGEVFLEAHGDPCGAGARRHWLLSLSASNGAMRWAKPLFRSPSELVADELGNLFFRAELPGEGEWRKSYLVAWSSNGEELWRAGASWTALPVAAVNGWLLDAERTVWRTSTAAVAFQLPFEPAWAGQRNAFTLVDESSAFVIASPKGQCPGPDCSVRLHRVDLGAGKIDWSALLASNDRISITAPLLTSDGSILFAQSGEHNTLREFSSDGREIRSDRLPPGNYRGAAALVVNRWVAALGSPATQLRAFETHVEPARQGWMSWCGDPGCAGRPQEERRAVAARRPPRR